MYQVSSTIYVRFFLLGNHLNRIFKEFPGVATVEIEKTISLSGYLLALVCVVFLLQRESAKTGHKVYVMITSCKNPDFALRLLNTFETPDNL